MPGLSFLIFRISAKADHEPLARHWLKCAVVPFSAVQRLTGINDCYRYFLRISPDPKRNSPVLDGTCDLLLAAGMGKRDRYF